MDEFLNKTRQDFVNANTFEELNVIKIKLQAIENDPQIAAVRYIIQKLRDNENWYTVDMSARADRIEVAMARVPVEERRNIMLSTSDEAKEVRKALVSHCHFWRSDVYLV